MTSRDDHGTQGAFCIARNGPMKRSEGAHGTPFLRGRYGDGRGTRLAWRMSTLDNGFRLEIRARMSTTGRPQAAVSSWKCASARPLERRHGRIRTERDPASAGTLEELDAAGHPVHTTGTVLTVEDGIATVSGMPERVLRRDSPVCRRHSRHGAEPGSRRDRLHPVWRRRGCRSREARCIRTGRVAGVARGRKFPGPRGGRAGQPHRRVGPHRSRASYRPIEAARAGHHFPPAREPAHGDGHFWPSTPCSPSAAASVN